VTWTLTQDPYDDTNFYIGEDCPYYDFGDYTEGTVGIDHNGKVTGFYGPWNEFYTRV